MNDPTRKVKIKELWTYRLGALWLSVGLAVLVTRFVAGVGTHPEGREWGIIGAPVLEESLKWLALIYLARRGDWKGGFALTVAWTVWEVGLKGGLGLASLGPLMGATIIPVHVLTWITARAVMFRLWLGLPLSIILHGASNAYWILSTPEDMYALVIFVGTLAVVGILLGKTQLAKALVRCKATGAQLWKVTALPIEEELKE